MMSRHFETLLRNILAEPEARLSSLEILTNLEKQRRASEEKQSEELNAKKLLTARRKNAVMYKERSL
jgi:hypothetical protein